MRAGWVRGQCAVWQGCGELGHSWYSLAKEPLLCVGSEGQNPCHPAVWPQKATNHEFVQPVGWAILIIITCNLVELEMVLF